MSLKALHTQVAGYRAQASELADEFARTHAEVADDDNLTPAGKRERLEPLHQAVVEKMHALHRQEKAAVREMREKLERRLFGLSPAASANANEVISYRDAASLARELEDSDAAFELYEQAKQSADTTLAAAVMKRALVRGWSTIVNDYLDRNPTARDDLDDLAALARYTDNTLAVTARYIPPSLNLPYSAGFPKIGGQTSARPPAGPVPLPTWMTNPS